MVIVVVVTQTFVLSGLFVLFLHTVYLSGVVPFVLLVNLRCVEETEAHDVSISSKLLWKTAAPPLFLK